MWRWLEGLVHLGHHVSDFVHCDEGGLADAVLAEEVDTFLSMMVVGRDNVVEHLASGRHSDIVLLVNRSKISESTGDATQLSSLLSCQ